MRLLSLPQRGCTRADTQARQTHWNEHERANKQGLLELGFYRGLYSVWERTLEKYPSVWIEGCVSAAGATVCCLSHSPAGGLNRQAEGA